MNKCIFTGRVTSKPEIYPGKDNYQNKVARFGFAVDDPYLKDNQQNTVFINCVCFSNSKVDLLEKYVDTGDALGITASFRTGEYVDKNGSKHQTHEFVVSDLEFNETKAAKDARKNRQPANDYAAPGYNPSFGAGYNPASQQAGYGQGQQLGSPALQQGYGQLMVNPLPQQTDFGQSFVNPGSQQAGFTPHMSNPAGQHASNVPPMNNPVTQQSEFGKLPIYGATPQKQTGPIIPGTSLQGMNIPNEVPFN